RMRYVQEQFYLRSAEEMKALFSEIPEAVQNTLEVAEKCNVEIEFGKLHYPVFTPPEHFTREGYLRQLLAEGLNRRSGLHARAEGEEFIVDSLEDARQLPTFVGRTGAPPVPADASSAEANRQFGTPGGAPGGTGGAPVLPITDLSDPTVAAALKAVIDRLQMEMKVIE